MSLMKWHGYHWGLVEDSATTRLIFSVIFNIIAMGFMIRPSTIISTVGEVMTPALLVLLLVVGITVFCFTAF